MKQSTQKTSFLLSNYVLIKPSCLCWRTLDCTLDSLFASVASDNLCGPCKSLFTSSGRTHDAWWCKSRAGLDGGYAGREYKSRGALSAWFSTGRGRKLRVWLSMMNDPEYEPLHAPTDSSTCCTQDASLKKNRFSIKAPSHELLNWFN